MDFKYWRPFILFLASVHEEEGTYVPQGGMIHLIQQLMKRSKGLSIVVSPSQGSIGGMWTTEATERGRRGVG